MSDTYYVRAYHNKRKINIPIEEKHQYYESTDTLSAVKPASATANGYNMYGSQIEPAILFSSNWISFTRGTDSDDYIGEKLQLKSIDMTIAMYMTRNMIQAVKSNFNSYAPIYEDSTGATVAYRAPNYASLMAKTWAKFRFMIIKFNDPLTGDGVNKSSSVLASMRADLRNWFYNTYIYYPEVSTNVGRQSVHQNKLRESQIWTGKFRILYDSKMSISENKPLQFEKLWAINKNVNIDDGQPTHDSVKNIYFVIFPPAFNEVDLSPNINNYLAGVTADDIQIGTILTNTKISYYDL